MTVAGGARPGIEAGDGLLVICNWRDLDHPSSGGAEVVCENLARQFAGLGRRVVYLTAAVAGRPAEEIRDGYRIIRGGGQFGVYPFVLSWLARHRREIGAVIDSQNGIPFFSPLAVKATTPVALLMHHVHQDQMAGALPGPLAALGRFLEGPASRVVYRRRAIVAVSPSTRTEIRRTLKLSGPIAVAPPGLDPAPAIARHRASHPRIVCVGRLSAHKRTELIIDMVPRLRADHPDLQVHIVGDGVCRSQLESYARRVGVTDVVTFHGSVPASRRDALLASAWISINASAAEGWGLSVIEANAMGVPVVAGRRPGLRDSIRHGETGWLVDADEDLADVASAALTELADLDRAAEWGRRTRAWAACFTWPEMAARVDAAFAQERSRLQRPAERRRVSDVVTLVHIPERLTRHTPELPLRDGDRILDHSAGKTVILPGADTSTARAALRRAGVPPILLGDPSVRFRVARPVDLVVPTAAFTSTPRAGDAK